MLSLQILAQESVACPSSRYSTGPATGQAAPRRTLPAQGMAVRKAGIPLTPTTWQKSD